MEIALAVIAIVLSLAGNYIQEGHIAVGNEYKDKITSLAKKIYSKIANNQVALDKLNQAYQNRNAGLANAIFSQAGFGAAVRALNKEYKENEQKFKEEQSKTNKENTDLQNKYNELMNASAQTGTIAGNKYARETFNQVGQAVQGGLDDYTHQDVKDKNTEIIDNINSAFPNGIPEPHGVY